MMAMQIHGGKYQLPPKKIVIRRILAPLLPLIIGILGLAQELRGLHSLNVCISATLD